MLCSIPVRGLAAPRASYDRAVLRIDRIIMVALWGAGHAIESHPLAHTLGVEHIIQVQQNYVVTQENIPAVTKSFMSEAGPLTTLIKVLFSYLCPM